MKKMLFLLLFTNLCMAQGFIEVEVRDTLVMKPVGFVYEVSIAENYDYAAMVDTVVAPADYDLAKYSNDRKNAEIKKLRDLENFLKKSKYAYEESKNYDTGYSYGRRQKGYLIKLKTQAELDKLTKEVGNNEEWKGDLSDINYGNPEAVESKLMDKLIKKAKTKAATIAGMTGQKLGPITEFRELKQSENLNLTVVDLIMNGRRNSSRDFFKSGLNSELSKTVIVRFKAD